MSSFSLLLGERNACNSTLAILFKRTQRTGFNSEGEAMEMGDSSTELRLGLPGREGDETLKLLRSGKRMLPKRTDEERESVGEAESIEESAPATKSQMVGWPPIRSYRKNCFTERMREKEGVGLYVKVRMDGAPYMRKVDLNAYKGYKDLRQALEGLFACAVSGFHGEEDTEKARMDVHVITYEDKDGDWMLAGDVPWEMFKSTCKRLRIMKCSEARGLSL